MLQIANLEEYNESQIPALLKQIEPILAKRKQLHEKYTRGANQSAVLFSGNTEATKLPFEKFITDLATGYTAGKPTYSVDLSKDEEKNRILKELLGKEAKSNEYQQGMQILIEYITNYNDDAQENYDLIHDVFEMTAAYEVLYENYDNEIVYSRYSPLQTVATWDYRIPANLTGLIRTWDEKDLDDNIVTKVELTDVNGIREYAIKGEKVVLVERKQHLWNDVPAFAVETDFAVFESAEDVIQAYEQLVQNVRNTFQYNDTDCKLKIVGYTPENPITVLNDDGDPVVNKARLIEDEATLNAKTLYMQEGGDVAWVTKDLDASGVETVLKLYQDLIFQMSGIPNTSDLAFNSSDLNASAIDRKFYIMNMATVCVVSLLKKAYLRRWELIFNRINLKKGTKFDFRDVVIDIPKNLPSNNDELIDSMLKMKDLLSSQTILETLGYNFLSEKEKKDQEAEDSITKNLERWKQMGIESENKADEEVNDEQSADNRQTLEEDGEVV